MKNEALVKLNRLQTVGHEHEFLNNLASNLQILDAKKEIGKVKKYKAYYVELTSDSHQSDEAFTLEVKLVNGLIKLYEYYIYQIDKSFAPLDRKAQETLEMNNRNNKLLSADNLIETGDK